MAIVIVSQAVDDCGRDGSRIASNEDATMRRDQDEQLQHGTMLQHPVTKKGIVTPGGAESMRRRVKDSVVAFGKKQMRGKATFNNTGYESGTA